jgi:hypothetical protein
MTFRISGFLLFGLLVCAPSGCADEAGPIGAPAPGNDAGDAIFRHWTRSTSDYFSHIEWYDGDSLRTSPTEVLKVQNVPLSEIGTDPAQSRVLADRRVDTAGFAGGTPETRTPGMGLDTTVCTPPPPPTHLRGRRPRPPTARLPGTRAGLWSTDR